MPGVIYRTSDGQVVYPVAPEQPFRGVAVEVDRNVLPNYGGDAEDFAWLELDAVGFQHLTTLDDVRVVDGAVHGAPRTPTLEPAVDPPAPMSWATQAQAEIDAQRKILDLILLGGLTDGGTLDGAAGEELPDLGGTLDDLEGLDPLDLTPLPDDAGTLDDLGGQP